MRIYYRARRSCLVEALAPLEGASEILGAPAGHHLPLRLHLGLEEAQLVARAQAAGVRIYPVSPYFLGPVPEDYRSTVLLGFGGLEDNEIRRGAQLLIRAWTQKGANP
jgi:GntR family transcriptional regulator/MocR family aminotransferase